MRGRHLQALAGITALAALLRFATLDTQSYWLDEAVTVRLLELPFGDMLDRLPESESTPPLYYLLAWLWSQLAGTGEVGLRSLSALFGTATVPVAYMAARELVDERAGVAAALLAAASPLLVWYSQEARAYALLVLLTSVSFLLFARALRRRDGLGWWALVSALALGTHYFAAFPLVAEALWLLRARGRGALLPVAVVGAVGAALVPLAVSQSDNPQFIEGTSLGKRVLQLPKQYLIGFDAPAELALALAAAAAAAVGLALALRERHALAPAVLVALAASGLPVALALVGEDYFVTRNALGGLVPALLLVAAGAAVSRAGDLAVGLLAALGVAVTLAVAIEPSYQREDWRGAAEALGPAPPGGRAIVLTPAGGAVPLELYLPDAEAIGPEGAEVTELAFVGLAPRQLGEGREPPRGNPMPPAGLGGERRTEEDTYTLVRFSGPEPVGVTFDALSAQRLGTAPVAVLVER